MYETEHLFLRLRPWVRRDLYESRIWIADIEGKPVEKGEDKGLQISRKQDMKKSDNIPTETEGWSVRAQNVKRFGHDKYKPMICKNCKDEFPTRDLLDKHFGYSDTCDKLLHAPPRNKKERRFCCDSCGESFVTEHRFRR